MADVGNDERLTRLWQQAADRGEPVPNFDDREALVAWARTDGPDDAFGLGRYLSALWSERVDLLTHFHGLRLDPACRERFRSWVLDFGAAEANIAPELLPMRSNPDDAAFDTTPRPLEAGVTAIGYQRALLGIGIAGRRVTTLLETAGERVHRRTYDHTRAPLMVAFAETDRGGTLAPNLDIALLAVNSRETPLVIDAFGSTLSDQTYRIGYWAWELEDVPPVERAGFEHVDEIWTYSSFVRDAFARVAPPSIPVFRAPLGVDLQRPQTLIDRQLLGLPDGPLIGFAFDYASSFERKNPRALVDAYMRAVPSPGTATLVLKTLNEYARPEKALELRELAAGRPDIVMIDRAFTNAEHVSFLAHLDAFVSLHRSEGYGLGLLEAMTLGVPVVATAYSGNLEFMNESNSFLIPYARIPTVTDGPYDEGSHWADPDVDAAASAIRAIVRRDDVVEQRRQQALRDASAVNEVAVSSAWFRERLEQIRVHARQRVTGP